MNASLNRKSVAIPIHYGDTILQMGSCFSTHISHLFRYAGFQVMDNPFGVVFHPIAIANQLEMVLNNSIPERFIQRDDIWLHYNTHSSFYDFSKEQLKRRLEEQMQVVIQQIKQAKIITVTFGSAHGYRLQSDGMLTANCHQVPATSFTKECTSAQEIVAYWIPLINDIKAVNKDVEFIFTVSPVKYERDGCIENNRSKSQLILACELLEKEKSVIYFPSYELVTDILRDYRYFEVDGVHPNQLAIQQVWNLFENWFFDEETMTILKEVKELRAREEHRLLFPDSQKGKAFIRATNEKREKLLSLYPTIHW